jgi:hypothetical protein
VCRSVDGTGPVKGQIDDLLAEIRDRASRNQRVLITILTKRMAEDLANYYTEVGVRCRYMHSEIETLERIRLRREGLDLPEVSLAAILDADKEGLQLYTHSERLRKYCTSTSSVEGLRRSHCRAGSVSDPNLGRCEDLTRGGFRNTLVAPPSPPP